MVPAGFASGENNARRHALKVPLQWTANGLVEVIQFEHEFAIGAANEPGF